MITKNEVIIKILSNKKFKDETKASKIFFVCKELYRPIKLVDSSHLVDYKKLGIFRKKERREVVALNGLTYKWVGKQLTSYGLISKY